MNYHDLPFGHPMATWEDLLGFANLTLHLFASSADRRHQPDGLPQLAVPESKLELIQQHR